MSPAAAPPPSTRLPVMSLIAVSVLAACATPSADPSLSAASASQATATPAPSPTASASAPASVEDRAEAIFEDVAGEPDWPLEGFGSLWLLAPDSEEPSLLRVDPATNEIVASIVLPGSVCQGFTMSDDAVWACATTGVVRIDPETNAITHEVAFEAGPAFGSLAFGSGSVWALGADGGALNQLVRVDPVAMTSTTIPLGHGSSTLAYGFDAVWVTALQDGTVLRVDPATDEVTAFATGLPRPQVLSVGPDSLWVTLQRAEDVAPDEPTVVRIDPNDGAVVAEIPTGATPFHIWADTDAVWVCSRDLFLARIDPATNEVVETLTGPPSTCAVTVAFDSVWATAGNALKVYRFAP